MVMTTDHQVHFHIIDLEAAIIFLNANYVKLMKSMKHGVSISSFATVFY